MRPNSWSFGSQEFEDGWSSDEESGTGYEAANQTNKPAFSIRIRTLEEAGVAGAAGVDDLKRAVSKLALDPSHLSQFAATHGPPLPPPAFSVTEEPASCVSSGAFGDVPPRTRAAAPAPPQPVVAGAASAPALQTRSSAEDDLKKRIRVALLVLDKRPSKALGALRMLRRLVHEDDRAVDAVLAADIFRALAKSVAAFAGDGDAGDNAAKLLLALLNDLSTEADLMLRDRSHEDVQRYCCLSLQVAARVLLPQRPAASPPAAALVAQAAALLRALAPLPAYLAEEGVAARELAALLARRPALPVAVLDEALGLMLFLGQEHAELRQQLRGKVVRVAVRDALLEHTDLSRTHADAWIALLQQDLPSGPPPPEASPASREAPATPPPAHTLDAAPAPSSAAAAALSAAGTSPAAAPAPEPAGKGGLGGRLRSLNAQLAASAKTAVASVAHPAAAAAARQPSPPPPALPCSPPPPATASNGGAGGDDGASDSGGSWASATSVMSAEEGGGGGGEEERPAPLRAQLSRQLTKASKRAGDLAKRSQALAAKSKVSLRKLQADVRDTLDTQPPAVRHGVTGEGGCTIPAARSP